MIEPFAQQPQFGHTERSVRRPAFAMMILVLLATVAGPGCGREFFREWADQDVSEAIFEKSRDPRWRLETFSIEPPALSRFADPYDPDRPPAPPDDFATEKTSPVPQWPHHRLITPVEGTGYLNMLDAWRDQAPQALSPTRPGIADGPAPLKPSQTPSLRRFRRLRERPAPLNRSPRRILGPRARP